MQFTFLGCGDAFGSGGRFNTCFHVQTADTQLLIDCGASALISMKAQKIDRDAIEAILITHFHGDHFGGVPYFILDAQFSKRTRPLEIIGPPGLKDWYVRVLETTFPGSSDVHQNFNVRLHELEPDVTVNFDRFLLRATRVRHGPDHIHFFAYRLLIEGKAVAYTGDTEWVEGLIDICKDADLLVAEAYYRDKKVPMHLDLKTLEAKLELLKPRKLVLTHMSEDMLRHAASLPYETASDGMVLHL